MTWWRRIGLAGAALAALGLAGAAAFDARSSAAAPDRWRQPGAGALPSDHDPAGGAPDPGDPTPARRSEEGRRSPPETAVSGATSAADATAARCPAEPPLDVGALPAPLALTLALGDHTHHFGTAAIGTPTRGALLGGVELLESETIERAGGYPYGTPAAVRAIERASREVARCHPGSPRLVVGDLSRREGGWLRPHRSHQSGLDADLGYFYRGPSTWYQRATAQNLDVARTWTLVRALLEGGNVDTIFIDASLQRLLRAHAESLPPDERPADGTFPTPLRRDAKIRHAWGHATHLHVRFRDEEAERLGARVRRARDAASGRRAR